MITTYIKLSLCVYLRTFRGPCVFALKGLCAGEHVSNNTKRGKMCSVLSGSKSVGDREQPPLECPLRPSIGSIRVIGSDTPRPQ